ncbi:MAG: glucuronate isomerase [bacterium]|jgi:hypothetical protein|nr:glucuronate isomerase [bacterium]
MLLTLEKVRQTVKEVVDTTPLIDIHTHLFAPQFGDLLLWGIDELLTYHYLTAEVLRIAPISLDEYWKMSKQEMAEYSWEHLFRRRSPVSEACRGVLTCLEKFGIDPTEKSLETIRRYYAQQKVDTFIDKAMDIANVKSMVMTNDPFDPQETPVWNQVGNSDPRFQAALRIDPLLLNWGVASDTIREQGFKVSPDFNDSCVSGIKKFLDHWGDKMNPRYMAVSLPPTFTYPDDSLCTRVIDSCVIPFAMERKIPFAMMIGVKKLLHPGLRLAGDSVGKSKIASVENLCLKYPNARFLVTFLSRENQHELCVTARKFNNLMPFGCWWFMNNPSIIEEMTRERLELLGLSFIPQHSDARVLDQIVYKWKHSRRIIGQVLGDKYVDVVRTGWPVTKEEIEADVRQLFETNFERFVSGQ